MHWSICFGAGEADLLVYFGVDGGFALSTLPIYQDTRKPFGSVEGQNSSFLLTAGRNNMERASTIKRLILHRVLKYSDLPSFLVALLFY